jgi:hypothetical protein
MKISHLPPSYEKPDESPQIEIPPLPQNTTLAHIYSSFIEYLYTKTKKFFVESLPNGQNIWDRLEDSIVMIFCIPNGWDISQQTFIRNAVINAGLVSANEADDRIEFITEGEASVHYAVAYTSSARWLKGDTMFTVIDTGGSTIDSTLYECKSIKPLRLEEVCASECVQVNLKPKQITPLIIDLSSWIRYAGWWRVCGSCCQTHAAAKVRRFPL